MDDPSGDTKPCGMRPLPEAKGGVVESRVTDTLYEDTKRGGHRRAEFARTWDPNGTVCQEIQYEVSM